MSGTPQVTVRSAGDLHLEAPAGTLRVHAQHVEQHITGDHRTEVGGTHTVHATGDVTLTSGATLGVAVGARLADVAGATAAIKCRPRPAQPRSNEADSAPAPFLPGHLLGRLFCGVPVRTPLAPLAMPPVARLGDACVSPTGKAGKITTGSDYYFVEDRPAARVGDTVTYSDGSTTVIAEADPGLIVKGRGVARMGYRLADGGRIIEGSSMVFSDDPYPGAGSVAEQTMAAARRAAAAFMPVNCEVRFAQEEPTVAEPEHAAPPDEAPIAPVPLTRDLARGGRPEFHGLDATSPDPDGAAAAAGKGTVT